MMAKAENIMIDTMEDFTMIHQMRVTPDLITMILTSDHIMMRITVTTIMANMITIMMAITRNTDRGKKVIQEITMKIVKKKIKILMIY